MKIFRAAQIPSEAGDVKTFTGDVVRTTLASDKAGTPVNVYRVEFSPGARTHWHTHDQGQILVVTSGGGRARSRDGSGGRLAPGDVVWIPPGEEHWHGADADSYMVHLAISLGGHDWLDPVTDEEYEEGWS